jgi:hyperosmotically inducible protein
MFGTVQTVSGLMVKIYTGFPAHCGLSADPSRGRGRGWGIPYPERRLSLSASYPTHPFKEFPMKTTLQYKTVGNALMLTGLMIVLGLVGCEKEGSAEKAGKSIDRASESAIQKIDKTAEKATTEIQGAKESAAQKIESVGEYIDDAAITTQVKTAILNDPMLSASRIEVTTNQGVVKLSGTVDSEQGISRAMELANTQQGVKSVQTDLSVSATAPVK